MKFPYFLLSAAALTMISGCASNTFEAAGAEHPMWVVDPDIAEASYPNHICGTGIGSNISDIGLGRDAADQHAYVQIAERLGLRASGEINRRAAFNSGGETDDSQETITVEGVRTTQVDVLLNDVEIKKRWISPQGNWYSLACLDKNDLDETTRNLIEERLDAEISRGGNTQ